MKKKVNKYDIIIYTSLGAALILIAFGSIDYFKSYGKKETIKEEIQETINDITVDNEMNPVEDDVESEELINLDKKSIIRKYLDQILDRTTKNDIIDYNMIKTWSTYEVMDVTYLRKIATSYYAYEVNLKLTGPNLKLPTNKNDELSTNEYTVITLKFNILKSGKQNGYIVKSIET